MQEIVHLCKAAGYLQIIAVIGSIPSVNFHRKHGFVWCGTWHNVGVRWGKYVSVHNLQLFLQDAQHSRRVAAAKASGDHSRTVTWSDDDSTPPSPLVEAPAASACDAGASVRESHACARSSYAWLLHVAIGVAAGVLLGRACKR